MYPSIQPIFYTTPSYLLFKGLWMAAHLLLLAKSHIHTPSTTINLRLVTTHLINLPLNTTNLLHNTFISTVQRSLNSGSFTLICQITHTYTFNNNQPMVNNRTSHQFTPQYNQSSTKSLHIHSSRVIEWWVIYSYLPNYTYTHPSTTINPRLVTTHLINVPLNTTNLLHNCKGNWKLDLAKLAGGPKINIL